MAAITTTAKVGCDDVKLPVPRDPKILPCAHVLPMHELKVLLEKAGKRWLLSCPVCAEPFSLVYDPDVRCQPQFEICQDFVRDEYLEKVADICAIPTRQGKQPVAGVTIISDKICAVYKDTKIVFVYTITSLSNRQEFSVSEKSTMEYAVEGMRSPQGIAAKKEQSCVYIVDEGSSGRLWRMTITNGVYIYADLTVRAARGVSVNCDDIIVISASPNMLHIYSDYQGRLVKKANFPLQSMDSAFHAVRLSDARYVVCHGWSKGQQHRVVDAGTDGQPKSAYGTSYGGGNQELSCPLNMCIDKDDNIFVVDNYNHRIQMLTRHLQLVRHLVTKDDGLQFPTCVCLDDHGVMYVGMGNGEIRVCRVKAVPHESASANASKPQ